MKPLSTLTKKINAVIAAIGLLVLIGAFEFIESWSQFFVWLIILCIAGFVWAYVLRRPRL